MIHSAVYLCRLGLHGCTSIEPVYYVGSRDSSESRPVEAEELHLKYFEKPIEGLGVWWSFKKSERFSKSKWSGSARYLCFVFATEITN